MKGKFENLNWKRCGEDEMVEGRRFLDGGVCLRSVLDRVLDGSVREGGCLDGEEELCFVC